MSASDAATSDRCPYCGDPKNRHTYASPTSCVLAIQPGDLIGTSPDGVTFVPKEIVTCPHCGRKVLTFSDPVHGTLMFGHRASEMHTPETPWCEGGGRSV